jgi:DNA repair protein RadB
MDINLNNFIDDLLGPLQTNTITSFYGSPGIGKSTLCFEYASAYLKTGKKVIYVDTEGGFSAERLKQINPEINLNNIIVISPKTFEDQQKVISSLNKQITNARSIGLVIVDSLVMLYRLKLGDSPKKINSDLGEQLRLLTEIARGFNIPVIVTNHMYVDFDTKEKKMSGGNVMEYWSKTILELDKDDDLRYARLKKHKFKPESKKIDFYFENCGLVSKKNSRTFNFFSKEK